MNKSIKQLIIIFIVAALIVPMFISCDDGGSVDLKAEFLGKLNTKIEAINNTNIDSAILSGQNITITFENTATINGVKDAASTFVTSIASIVTSGTLTFTELAEGKKTYSLSNLEMEDLKNNLKEYILKQTPRTNVTLSYTASVVYQSETINLTGTLALKNIPIGE